MHDARAWRGSGLAQRFTGRLHADGGPGELDLALVELASDALTHVFALHRSRTNNTADLAQAAIERQVRELGLGVSVTVARQVEPCDSCAPQSTLFHT